MLDLVGMLGHGTRRVRVTFCFDALSVDDGLNLMCPEGIANDPRRLDRPRRVRLSGLLAVVRARLCADARRPNAGLPWTAAGQRTCA